MYLQREKMTKNKTLISLKFFKMISSCAIVFRLMFFTFDLKLIFNLENKKMLQEVTSDFH